MKSKFFSLCIPCFPNYKNNRNFCSKLVFNFFFLFILLLGSHNKVFAQAPESDYEIIDVEDEAKAVCWPLVGTSKTQATSNKVKTDTSGTPSGMSGGLAPSRRFLNAVLVPNSFPNPDTVEVFTLNGNPLIINGTLVKFIDTSLEAAQRAQAQLGGNSSGPNGFHWVGYKSNLFQPDNLSVYYYNLFHRWYGGMPCHYENFGGKQWNGDNYKNASGLYTDTPSDTLFEPHPVFASISQPITCYGGNNGIISFNTPSFNYYTYQLNSNPPTLNNAFTSLTAGTYTLTITDSFANSCDTVITLTQPASTGTSTTVANCGAFTWSTSGTTYNASGTYYYTSTVAGSPCPKQDTLVLTVSPVAASSTTVTAYNFYTWSASGLTYTSSGNYFHSSLTAGCFHADTLHLFIINSPFNINIVVDQPISCHGLNDGTIHATAFPSTNIYTYVLDGGAQVNSSGFFQGLAPGIHTVCAYNGPIANSVCKTITLTQPSPITISIITDSIVSCLGNNGGLHAHISGGTPQLQSYLTFWTNSANILLNPGANNHDTSITGLTPGIYHLTVEDDNGCMNTANAILNQAAPLIVTANVNPIQCSGGTTSIIPSSTGGIPPITYTMFGSPLAPNYAAGTYTITATDAKGCTATTEVDFGQPAPISSTMIASSCGSYYWSTNGATYTATGMYTANLITLNGCHVTAMLNLTINNNTTSNVTMSACNSYYWNVNNVTYTASGIYTATSLNALGCLHTTTLQLSINQSTTGTKTATACDSYNWSATGANNPYTVSGNYLATSINAAGCVHTDTLHLTINNSTSGSQTTTACNSYTWNIPGSSSTTYTVSGNYIKTSLNAAGCLRTDTLHLTINYSTTGSQSVSACDSYTWNLPGSSSSTYTLSGNYIKTTLNAAGCIRTDTLHLTINYSTTGSQTISACNSYTWNLPGSSSSTYTLSGNYIKTTTNAAGCLRTDTLHLTINYSTTGSQTISACNSYTWNIPGSTSSTYTVSGNYIKTTTNAAGCLRTDTLHLTINYSTTSSQTVTACNSYTWNLPSSISTYTISGNYIKTSTNAAGCLHTDTLHLTIKNSSSSTSNISASNGYLWTANNVTYTISGVYTATLTNAVGCDSILTLNLTIIQIPSQLSLRCFIQGYMQSSSQMRPVLYNQGSSANTTVCDSITVELHQTTAPYNIAYFTKVVMSRTGFSTCTFPPLFGNYYIVVKHRNAIKTWSSIPMFFGSSVVNYNFTVNANKAYGNNQVQVGSGVWAFFSGDINHDQNIDLLDLDLLEYDIEHFNFGNLDTDLDGDGSVDLLDLPQIETNISNFIHTLSPAGN